MLHYTVPMQDALGGGDAPPSTGMEGRPKIINAPFALHASVVQAVQHNRLAFASQYPGKLVIHVRAIISAVWRGAGGCGRDDTKTVGRDGCQMSALITNDGQNITQGREVEPGLGGDAIGTEKHSSLPLASPGNSAISATAAT